MKHLILLISFTILGAPIASAGTNSAVLDTGTDEDKRFKDRYSIEGQFDTAAEASVDLHACTACGSKTDLRSSLGKIVGTSAVATSIESGVKGQRVPYYEASKLQPIPNEADLDEAQANQVLIYSLRHQQPVGNGTRILTEDTILAPKHVVYDSETMERIARVSEILVCFGDDFRGVKFQLSQGNLSNCYSV